MSSVWTCSDPWTERGTNGRSANSGVHWHMPIKLHGASLWAQVPQQDPHAALTPPSERLFLSVWSEVHTSSLLEAILEGSGSAHPVPPCTKEQIAVLLLGPPYLSMPVLSTALSSSPRVMACLQLSPPCSWDCAGRHTKRPCDGMYVPF